MTCKLCNKPTLDDDKYPGADIYHVSCLIQDVQRLRLTAGPDLPQDNGEATLNGT